MSRTIKRAARMIMKEERLHKVLPDGSVTSYPDPLHGWKVATIGFGTTRYPDGTPVKRGDVITRFKAVYLLVYELVKHIKPYLERIPKWEMMNGNQHVALYDFAYNLGPAFYKARNFESITMLCDSPWLWDDKKWVTEQFSKYCNPGSVVAAGLLARRKREAELFLKEE